MVQWYPGITLEEMERQVVLSALQHFQYNRTQTAAALGVTVRTIQNKLHAYFPDKYPKAADGGEAIDQELMAQQAEQTRKRGRPPVHK